ncbi:MAG: SusC/RagA family TonB-linked outer membrane protein [Paramuribaculum sp.]|nr:SusC/RagA family TonB-linked outer membrane protein [Paramuribaculum sp.]
MSKTLNVKTWAVLILAGLVSSGTAFAASSGAGSEAPQSTQQATGTVTGTVVDDQGDPLTGATVRVEGTSIAASANIDGEFTLAGVKNGAKITVSYIGFKPMTVTWTGGPLHIVMNQDGNLLDEVVVMGYGVAQKRTKVTNSISKVSEETLTVGMNANPAQALAGAVSGVKVNITSGNPGAAPNITVRGGTNWDGSASNPLIVVDGQIRGTSMSDINPNDIESMDVLKDAGATALYGARAANGVILITTKKGKQGNGKVTLSAKYGITNYSSGYDFLNGEDYIYWTRRATFYTTSPTLGNRRWLANFYANLTNGSQPYSTGRITIAPTAVWNILTYAPENEYLLQHGWQVMDDPINAELGTDNKIIFKDTDILGWNLQNNTASQDYNLSFSGGNDRGNYYASLGYYKADGALPLTFYERYNFSFTGGYKISNWLQANSVFTYNRANYNNSSNDVQEIGYVFGRFAIYPPTARFEDEEGNLLVNQYSNSTSVNMWFQPEKYHYGNQTDKFQMTQSLTATLIPGLTLKGTMSWYYSEYLGDYFRQDTQTNMSGAMDRSRPTRESFERTFNQTYNLVAQFNRTFAEKHTVNVMLGTEYYKSKYHTFAANGSNASTDDFGNLQYTDSGEGKRGMSSYTYKEKILSWFGRAEYDYMDKYLLAATFRSDGYSRLVNNRWGFFPGVSAGWVFTKENFWNDKENLSWLNYGKLRASYGLNGIVNPNVIGYYTLLGSYTSYLYNGQRGYRISGLPNVNLRWERTRTFDIGLDLGFLQNRFNVIATYYNRLTMDKYAQLDLPQTTGFSSVTNNNGSYRNQGVELEFNGTLLRVKDFQWTLGANITFNKNTIVKLPDNGLDRNRQGGQQVYNQNWDGKTTPDSNGQFIWVGGRQEGQEPLHIWGYKSNYILRSEADIEALGDYVDVSRSAASSVPIYANESGYQRLVEMGLAGGAVRLSPGDMIFLDRNGDNMIDQYDQFDLGNRMPHWTGGFNTALSWKGLQLYARFDMGFDFITYDGAHSWWMTGGQGTYNTLTKAKETWTPENPNAKYPRYVIASNMGTNSWCRISDLNAFSGNYLAVREVSLSYTFPSKICQKFRSQGLSLSVTGQNLGYLKKTTLPLPDNTTAINGTSGNAGTYNLPKTVIFGINVSF